MSGEKTMADQPISYEKLVIADKNADTLQEFIESDEDTTVISRLGRTYPSLAKAIKLMIEAGDVVPFPTTELLLAWTPDTAPRAAKALDTGKVYFWGKLSESETENSWYDTGLSELDRANQFTKDEISKLGIDQKSNNTDLSIAIVDEDYNRTWLEADEVGEPTEYSKQIIKKKIGISDHNQENISIAIVDEDDTRTWLEADESGKPTEYATQCIAEALQMSPDQSAQYYKSSYQDKVTKIVSGPNIVCWGDSMTAGAGAVHPYSYYLQQLLIQSSSNAQVRNCGVGGESSETICARQGGNPFLVKVNSGVINADASQNNPITLLSQGGTTVTPSPLLQGSGNPFESIGYFKGNLYGISGQIHPLNGGYVFVRDESGTSITANRPIQFYTNYSQELRDSIAIIWVGQNSNPSAGLDDLRAIQDAKAMIRHLKTLDKRYLVINKPISTPEEDKVWYAEFGDRYIPARSYLIQFGLEDAGITPTQQDLDSIAAGYVPNSLRFDNVHWNDYGYEILANLIFKKLKQLEWI